MICAISGEVPDEPVVSKRSGLLFERRLIERYIEDHGKCPVTKEELSMDDIVLVKTNKVVRPRPLQAASIPGLLGIFQNEWDALMLSNFALEQQLHTARQELSHALYQHDAACRVIARLKKERDESRALLALAERQIPASMAGVAPAAVVSNGKRAMEDEIGPDGKKIRPGINPVMIDELTECNTMLSAQRKKRQTVRIWQGGEEGNYSCIHTLKDHTAEVEAVTVHATQKYFVTAAKDNTWCFYDISTGSCLSQVGEASGQEGYTSASFHPDGLILGTGTTEAVVKIWDVKTQSNVAKFEGHAGPVTAMSFSENGYFLATAALDGVKLWDLRKLRNFRTFSPYDSDTPTNSVEFDFSGTYLAVAGSDIRVYQVANVKTEWNLIKTLPDLSGTGKVTSAKFGTDAKYIAVGSMDRNLRIFGLPGDDQMDDDAKPSAE
ncbi:hypothetical protein CFC21_006358 [Triticum aestivum]|uniref:Pre-mRNA-processing factor 19 n=3 Tax=Triticum TaxID=4564 RepID=A0A9R0Q754_TRITD|nr:hypothetical protein CFC21_006358 [Triticum aestivum]VAH04109.1 unnamed protein product [Triticum turgidum subsp. durum]VAH16151.1 unnamed protein product [Triticum turgidum subsp. durum]